MDKKEDIINIDKDKLDTMLNDGIDAAVKRIFAELNAIAETEHGTDLEGVLLKEPLRNEKSIEIFKSLKNRYGVD
jgi:hypothetical protein